MGLPDFVLEAVDLQLQLLQGFLHLSPLFPHHFQGLLQLFSFRRADHLRITDYIAYEKIKKYSCVNNAMIGGNNNEP